MLTKTYIPPPHKQRIESELAIGESILWSGQPIAKRLAMRSIPIVLFSIPWTAFAVFWTVAAVGFELPSFSLGFENIFRLVFPLFGLPFVLVGLGMMTSPYWLMRSARRTFYIVTDRRAIIFEAGFTGSTKIRSIDPEQMTDLVRNQRDDGSGELVFFNETSYGRRGETRSTPVGFLAVEDVREVENLVREVVLRKRFR